jgi:ubiquinone/menaquinone biosynthesis C-methylase UbiE
MTNLNFKKTVGDLAKDYCQQGNPAGWFEEIYAQANQNPHKIPWANLTPNPYLMAWLKEYQHLGDKPKALVIGCGLGDDAEILQKSGFNVTAFDVSATAINWCQQRFPDSQVNYLTADLFNLPMDWGNQFDLVWECRTIQSLPVNVREDVIKAISSVVKSSGILLLVTHLNDNDITSSSSPPWALNEIELNLFSNFGLTENKRYIYNSDNGTQIIDLEYSKN